MTYYYLSPTKKGVPVYARMIDEVSYNRDMARNMPASFLRLRDPCVVRIKIGEDIYEYGAIVCKKDESGVEVFIKRVNGDRETKTLPLEFNSKNMLVSLGSATQVIGYVLSVGFAHTTIKMEAAQPRGKSTKQTKPTSKSASKKPKAKKQAKGKKKSSS